MTDEQKLLSIKTSKQAMKVLLEIATKLSKIEWYGSIEVQSQEFDNRIEIQHPDGTPWIVWYK